MKRTYRVSPLALFGPALAALLVAGPPAARPSSAQTVPRPPAAQPGLPSETPASSCPSPRRSTTCRRDVMIPMRDGVKLHTVDPRAEGREAGTDPPDAHAVQRHRAHEPRRRAARTSAPILLSGYDNATDVIVEGGYIRVVQDVRGKYGSEGDYVMNRPAARAAEPDAGRSRHRHLRHDRLAGEERPGDQRQGRHPRDFLRRVPAADGAGQPASRAQGVGADEPDGRRLDGRRLVPQRRVPPAEHALHLRPGGHARERRHVVDEPLRRLRHVPAGGIGRRTRPPPRPGAGRLLEEAARAPGVRRVLARSGRRQDSRLRCRCRCR